MRMQGGFGGFGLTPYLQGENLKKSFEHAHYQTGSAD